MRVLIIAIALLIFAPLAYAADGDDCGISLASKGSWRTEKCMLICDDRDTTVGACTVFDTNDFGISDAMIIDWEDTTGNCSAQPEITITTSHQSDGTPSTGISTSAVVLDDDPVRVVIDTQTGAIDRYLVATMGGDLAACDGVDVRIFFVNRRN